jgi:hypothetical protein
MRIRIPNAETDPDPGGSVLGRKNASKRQIIMHKRIESNAIAKKWKNVTLFSLKSNFQLVFKINYVF